MTEMASMEELQMSGAGEYGDFSVGLGLFGFCGALFVVTLTGFTVLPGGMVGSRVGVVGPFITSFIPAIV